jgi:hypothetical protein
MCHEHGASKALTSLSSMLCLLMTTLMLTEFPHGK